MYSDNALSTVNQDKKDVMQYSAMKNIAGMGFTNALITQLSL